MFFRAIAGGFRMAARRPGLVLLLWAWHTGLALVAVLPFWSWVRSATALSPDTDVLLSGIQVGTLIELLQQHGTALPTLVLTVFALAALTMLSNAFVAGGTLEVLLGAGDERPLLHRFFRGAGHFFFRSLRLLALVTLVCVFVAGLATAAISAVLRPLTANGWEPGTAVAGMLTLAAIGVIVGLCLLSLDYARVLAVAGDRRQMVRTWLAGVRFMLGQPVTVAAIGLLFAFLVLGALALGAWLPLPLGATAWGAIVAALLLQQVLLMLRVGARVWQLASEVDLYRLSTPPEPVAPPAPVLGVEPDSTPGTSTFGTSGTSTLSTSSTRGTSSTS